MCCPGGLTTLRKEVPERRIFELHMTLRNIDKEEIAAYLLYSDDELEMIYQGYMYDEGPKNAG